MSLQFYLSSAAPDYSEVLKEFFEDLNCTVRARLLLSGNEQVGFFAPSGIANRHGWPPEVAEALRTSQTMVALISPHYFQSEHAGKEWQLFETRSRHKEGSVETTGRNPSAIVPVIWSPCDDPVPKVVDRALPSWGESYKIYSQNGLLRLLKLRRSLPSFGDEYVNVLVALAEQIVELARTVKLPALDAIQPWNEVNSAFNVSHAASGYTDESENGGKLKVAIVEDNQQVREMLEKYLSVLGYDCESYPEAEEALNDILSCQHQIGTFDVVLVDLELDHNKMQGLNLIERLAADDNSPPIIAMSSGLSNSEFVQALKAGADDVVPKPFDVLQIEDRIETLARIGRGRRRRRQEGSGSRVVEDRERPVFLSYSNIDWRTATILKTQIEARGIGVWYAPDNLDPKAPIVEEISKGLEKAEVFVALVTANYSRSAWCTWEMALSQRGPRNSALVIPVLDGLLHRIRNFGLIKPFTDKFVCDITFDRFADGLTVLLGHIRQAVHKNVKT